MSLRDGYLPIPTVELESAALLLEITALAAGAPGSSVAYVRYTATNIGKTPVDGDLFLAIRPFQVNPPWQSLHRGGGVAPTREIRFEDDIAHIDSTRAVLALTRPADRGAVSFSEGLLPAILAKGETPARDAAIDELEYASAAMRYPLRLAPGESSDVDIAVPLHDPAPVIARLADRQVASAEFPSRLAEVDATWRRVLDRVTFRMPAAARNLADSVRSTIAYILINRDGPAIQPGSRSYARSWIRDGAGACAALLETGFPRQAREFLRWFAR